MSDSKKTLGELVDEIEAKKEAIIKVILLLRYYNREGIDFGVDRPFAYNFEPGFKDLIIDTLADLYLNSKINPKKKKPKQLIDDGVLDQVILCVDTEINRIWQAIKEIGFSPQDANANPEEWQKAALRCFDENWNDFDAIKRSYLNKKKLFVLGKAEEDEAGCDSRQGIRNFKSRLLREIANDWLSVESGKWGGTNMLERLKTLKE